MKKHDKRLSITYPGKRESIGKIIEFCINSFRSFSDNKAISLRLELILEEILVNITDYAYKNRPGEIEVCIDFNHSLFNVEIKDTGDYFNPLNKDEPDLEKNMEEREVGGLGIHLVKKFTSNIEYKRIQNQNILKFSLGPQVK